MSDHANRSFRLLFALSLLIAGATLFASIYYYPHLPDRIPIHFGAEGKPDGYGAKQYHAFIGAIIQAAMLGLWLLTRRLVKRGRWTPGRAKQADTAALYRTVGPFMDFFFFVLIVLLGWLELETTMVALGRQDRIGPAAWWMMGGVIALSFILLILWLREFRKLKQTPARHDRNNE